MKLFAPNQRPPYEVINERSLRVRQGGYAINRTGAPRRRAPKNILYFTICLQSEAKQPPAWNWFATCFPNKWINLTQSGSWCNLQTFFVQFSSVLLPTRHDPIFLSSLLCYSHPCHIIPILCLLSQIIKWLKMAKNDLIYYL